MPWAGMFENEFPGLQKQFFIFEQLFKENIPALCSHFVIIFLGIFL